MGRDIPIAYGADSNSKQRNGDRDVTAGVRLMRVALLSACSPITMPDGRRVRIVDKDLDLCTVCEMNLEELSNPDAEAIFNAIIDISGFGKETAPAVQTFPQEQKDAGDAGSAGATLSPDALATTQAVAV